MGDSRAEYLHGLKRVARRARLAVVLRRLVGAALAGLGAGFAYLVVRPFLPAAFTPGHPLVAPVLLLGLALIAGAVVALAVRLDRAALAVQVDRSLGTRGLASAALELAEGRRSSAFADALLEDAAAALRDAGPRRVIARPRLRLLPWTLAAAVVVLIAGFSPYTLRDLFPARRPVDRVIAVLGGELEESARRLEEAAVRQDLREGLELSRELAQLGKDLAMQEAPAEELAQRLERALDALPERFREVYLLRQVQGLETNEAAACLGIEPGTVKTRLHRARALLREALDRDPDPLADRAYPFAGERCDRLVAAVLQRLEDERPAVA